VFESCRSVNYDYNGCPRKHQAACYSVFAALANAGAQKIACGIYRSSVSGVCHIFFVIFSKLQAAAGCVVVVLLQVNIHPEAGNLDNLRLHGFALPSYEWLLLFGVMCNSSGVKERKTSAHQ